MKRIIAYTLIISFFVITIAMGLTYSYYVPKITGNPTELTTKLSNRGVEVNYENGSNLLIDSSNTTVTKNITIKNNNETAVDYVLYFSDVSNTLADKTKLTYSYSCAGTGCNSRSNVEVPGAHGVLAYLVSLDSGITHTYEITLTYNGTPAGSFTGRIEAIIPVIYGVAFNNAQDGTRTNDAVGMTYTRNSSTIDSDFDTAEIYKEMTQEADSYGNQFIKIPRLYIRKTYTDYNIWTFQISKIQINSDYYLPECFINHSTGDVLEYVLVGKYEASLNGSNLESKNGVVPLVSQTISTFRTYATNNGSSYQLMDIHIVDMINTLFFVEFATTEAQKVMFGYHNFGSSLRTNGTTDGIATASGSPSNNTSGFQTMKYRGIENHYGHTNKFVDGINIRNYQPYVAKNPANYASDVFSGAYEPIGFTVATTQNYIWQKGYDPNYPYVDMAIVVGDDGSSNPYRDQFRPADGDRVAYFGGSMSDSWGVAGIHFWNITGDSSTATNRISARLVKKAF